MRVAFAIAGSFVALHLAAGAQAQSMVGWLEPGHQRVVVANNMAAEPRQVRFADSWETADYVPFQWRELRGELVFLAAVGDRVALEFRSRLEEIPFLFRLGQAGQITPGGSGRGSFLLGTAFGQRFSVGGVAEHCFSFLSSDVGESGSLNGRPRRALYGYACSPTETPRPEIERFLRDIDFVGDGFVESTMEASRLVAAPEAREFALGRGGDGDARTGLLEVPLGNAVWEYLGGG